MLQKIGWSLLSLLCCWSCPVLCWSDCGGGWWLFSEGDIMWNTNACHGYNSIQSKLAYASWPLVLLKTAPGLGCLLLSWSIRFIPPKSDNDATLNMFNWRMWDYEGSLYDKINTVPNLIRRLCLCTTRKIGISRDVISLFAYGCIRSVSSCVMYLSPVFHLLSRWMMMDHPFASSTVDSFRNRHSRGPRLSLQWEMISGPLCFAFCYQKNEKNFLRGLGKPLTKTRIQGR